MPYCLVTYLLRGMSPTKSRKRKGRRVATSTSKGVFRYYILNIMYFLNYKYLQRNNVTNSHYYCYLLDLFGNTFVYKNPN